MGERAPDDNPRHTDDPRGHDDPRDPWGEDTVLAPVDADHPPAPLASYPGVPDIAHDPDHDAFFAGGGGASRRRSSAAGALTMMGGTLASRVTGLIRNSLLNALFSKEISDAFITAFKVPNLFRELLAEGALTNSFIPVYATLEPEEQRRLSGALLGMLTLVNGLLMLLAYLTAPLLARLLIADPANVDVTLTAHLVRIVFPFLPAISFSALAMGILQAEERFLAPAWAPVALNVVTVGLMALFPGQAVMLTLAHVLGGVAQLVVQIPALVRLKLLPRLAGLWHPAMGSVVLLMLPFAFTTGGRQVLNVVASNVVTDIAAGAQTAFYNADLFLSLALGLFSISPALAYYSRLADNAVRDPHEFNDTLEQGLRFITFLTVPAGLALTIMARPAVEVIFNWKSLYGPGLDAARLTLSMAATAPLGLAVFPLGMFNLLVRVFYVRQRVVTPVVVVLAFLTLQGALYVLLVGPYGIAGLSWGTVIASWIQLGVLTALVYGRERFALGDYLRYLARVWLAGLLAAVVAVLVLRALPAPADWVGSLARVGVGSAVLAAVYALLGALLGLPEIARLLRFLRR
ncbi:MAG: murein biosynthesis integral membrane protein MurJ [Deinococcales bacterium]